MACWFSAPQLWFFGACCQLHLFTSLLTHEKGKGTHLFFCVFFLWIFVFADFVQNGISPLIKPPIWETLFFEEKKTPGIELDDSTNSNDTQIYPTPLDPKTHGKMKVF